jgi:hypothetical protein
LCPRDYGGIDRIPRSNELQDERLSVCALLTELDDAHAKEYESEIREIARDKIIQLGVRRVDQSRIFVDLVALRRWAERNLREGFARYLTLLSAGMDAGASGFQDELRKFLAGKEVSQNFLELPKNQASDLLVDLVSRLMRECMTNSEHGLDCYLSMRIRHGALSGQLRGPLEDQKIITQREGTALTYKPNEYWLGRLYFLPQHVRDALDERLTQFSRDYDDLVDTFANEFIQIWATDKKNGLFKIAIQQVRLRALAARIKVDTTFDDFINYCFELFWEVIETNLENIRSTIEQTIKPEINALFVSLEEDLETLIPSHYGTHEFNTAIRIARTDAQFAANQATEWFRLRAPESEPQFSFDQMIDIGLQCVKNIHRDFNPSIERKIDNLPLFFQLALLSDIFFIVFDNIQKHSGLPRPKVELLAKLNAHSIEISVINEVADEKNTTESRNRVEEIRRRIEEGSYQHGVRSEGGTGLMKLRKILGEPRPQSRLAFGFRSGAGFFVDLEIPLVEIRS